MMIQFQLNFPKKNTKKINTFWNILSAKQSSKTDGSLDYFAFNWKCSMSSVEVKLYSS